ncbi:MAG: hypothetical protein LCH73_13875 [Proteobacteria bacterium]|nr:hypothetical protein [Pseudomonadota bacterium]
MLKKNALGWGLLLGLAVAVSAAAAGPDCRLIDLGDVPGGDVASWAHGINRAGVVVGMSFGDNNASEAFRYDDAAGMQAIAQPGAVSYAVNRGGEVVGVVEGVYAFRWRDGQLKRLEDLPGGNMATTAYGINDAGVAVGTCQDGVGITTACMWPADEVTPVRLAGGPYASVARGINRQGDVVGVDRIVSPFRDRAVMWPQGGGMVELVAGSSQANAVNGNGVVVGSSEFGAFMWRSGVLQILPNGNGPGTHEDEALAINRNDTVVGSAMWGANRRAAIWKKGRIQDLNRYACVRHSGWVLWQATGINDNGDIVGNGTNPQGYSAAFKLVRQPPSGRD